MNEEIKITAGIPAFNADEERLERLLLTVKPQCPSNIILYADGDGKSYEKVREMGGVVLQGKTNMGPGHARQKILEACKTPYITFIDADDLLATPLFFEHAIKALDNDQKMIEASYTFLQMNEDGTFVPHEHDNIWVFGKVYRKSFLDKYKIGFTDSRSNEDTEFNTKIGLLCSEQEYITWFKDVAYYWMYNERSITRIGDNDKYGSIYSDGRCFVGWLEGMTRAVEHARKYRPFSGQQKIAETMMQSYFYHMKCIAEHPFYQRQQWHYIKKFYHDVYAEVGKYITDEALAEIYSIMNLQNGKNMLRVIPAMGIKEFFDRLKAEPYNEEDIWDIWTDMYKERPDLMELEVKCGVMPKNYWRKPSNVTIEKKRRK